MPNQSSTSLCWNCLWMMSILYNDGLEAGAEHVAVSIYRLNCTRLDFFCYIKQAGVTIKTTTIWSKELNMQLSQTPVVLTWAIKNVIIFIQVCSYKRKPYYISPTTLVTPLIVLHFTFYFMFLAYTIKKQQKLKRLATNMIHM